MNKLALVRRVARECRMTASATVPATTVNQTGNLLDAVTWTEDAWLELQLSNPYWRWMQSRFTLNTVAGVASYAYGACNDEYQGSPITRFSQWKIMDDIDPCTVYLSSAGVGTQGYLYFLPWEVFRMTYRLGTVTDSVPCHITIDPNNQIVLGPTPNDVYVVAGPYMKSAQSLALDTDTPDMPENYHSLIVYDAMRKYAGSESAAEIMARANTEGARIRDALYSNQGQKFRFARALV